MPAWGMIIEHKKSYKQTVKRSYKVTRAVLSNAAESKGTTDLLMTLKGISIIACTLNKAHPQVALDLEFSAGETITLSSRGGDNDSCSIHLTGYVLEGNQTDVAAQNGTAKTDSSKQKHKDLKKLLDKTMSDEDSDDMDYSALLEDYDGLDSDEEQDDDEEDDDEMGDDDSDEDGDEEEDDDDDEDGEEEEDDEDDEEEDEEEDVKPPPTKKNKKEAAQQQQQQAQKKDIKKEQKKPEKKEAAAPQTNGAGVGKVTNLAGGVKVKDTKEGNGAFAKPGKNVLVYYEGRVQGKNQIFDSCKQGSGFKFMLGRGTVIKGWDTGVAGMRVGGKRQITCPPNAAYGNRGMPPVIPPNATLVFDVELKNVL